MKQLLIAFALLVCLGLPAADKVDINKADKAGLEAVKGIGPSLAQKILDYRKANGPFKSVDDLENVNGIGPATLARMKPMVTVSTASANSSSTTKTPPKSTGGKLKIYRQPR